MNTIARHAVILICLAAFGLRASAAEISLRGFYQAKQSVVRLGDVADFAQVPEGQVDELEHLPLFPAPPEGLTRRITAQDVREIMSLHGKSFPMLRVTGECRVEGTSAASEPRQGMIRPASLGIGDPAEKKATDSGDRLVEEIIAYLQTKDRIPTQWRAELLLAKGQSEAIAAMERVEVSGGQAPWTGRQVFTLRNRNVPTAKPIVIKVDVQRLAQAVVAKGNIPMGQVITADDVEVGEINPLSLSSTVVLEVNEVVGKEAKRAIPAGQTVQTNMLQRPLIVKRGELITVYSVAAGVQIKASARSLADAALGDTVLLEATETKKQFQGRVTAPQEAMVFVDTPKVAGDPKPAPGGDRTARKTR